MHCIGSQGRVRTAEKITGASLPPSQTLVAAAASTQTPALCYYYDVGCSCVTTRLQVAGAELLRGAVNPYGSAGSSPVSSSTRH